MLQGSDAGQGTPTKLGLQIIQAFRISIVADVGVARMQAGHQAAATGSTYGIAAVKLRKAHAIASQAIDVWSANHLLAITAQLAPPQIVSQMKTMFGLVAALQAV